MGMTDLQFKAYIASQEAALKQVKDSVSADDTHAHELIAQMLKAYETILKS